MPYRAPIEEMLFVMADVVGSGSIESLPGFADCPPDVALAILREAGRFGTDVLAPLNRTGDRQGCQLENGAVRTPEGFAHAYRLFLENGWNGIDLPASYGGQELPRLLSTAVSEIWNATNLSFALCPMLTQCGARLLQHAGSDDLCRWFMPKLVSGEWTATMNLTEPQAGSDLSQIRARADPEDNHFRITGQKVFISFGDQDWTDNIIHFVLARLPDAPTGIDGISLFLVPKNLVDDAGNVGARNQVRCLSLEDKLGIHASPTAVMSFGEDGGNGALGYLVGPQNQGVRAMFAMMNEARLAVGVEGVGVAEGAFQHSRLYAGERLQGRRADAQEGAAPIIEHPDVRRMLLSMKARTEAIRALAYFVAGQSDVAAASATTDNGKAAKAIVDLLTPVTKAWSTDTAISVADTGIQVHGGMGFIEESGAPQYLRDARITAIYEGTNGIQAIDLVNRKIRRDSGRTVGLLIERIRLDLEADMTTRHPQESSAAVLAALERLEGAVQWLISAENEQAALATASPFLRLMGVSLGGWLMARAERTARQRIDVEPDNGFAQAKIATARFYAENILPETLALHAVVTRGAPSILAPMANEI